jgi:small subunit ribosomal protein S9
MINTSGRRKEAVARAYVSEGNGEILINGRPMQEYFPVLTHQSRVKQPLQLAGQEDKVSIKVNVNGGGISGQAGAVSLAIAKALVQGNEEVRGALRQHGLLTRDSRTVERKKPGQKKARKRFQFSKR